MNDRETRNLLKALDRYFESMVDIPRIKFGKKQSVETLINEEVLVFAKHLRSEKGEGTPRTEIIF